MKLGILGGSFDPPHHGHLIVAAEVHRRRRLDRVALMVAGAPPHKQDRRLSPPEHRLAMTRLAVEGDSRLEADDLEIRREGPSYTIDTVQHLKENTPELDELVFIIGSDSLAELHTWYRVDRLVQEVTLVTVARSDRPLADTGRLARLVGPEAMQRIRDNVVHIDPVGISSTAVRHLVHDGYSPRYYVPEPVARYIEAEGLYRG